MKLIGVTAFALMMTASAQAQQATPAGRGTQPTQPAAAQPAPVQRATQARPEPPGQPINVKLDLTISDQTGTAEPLKKMLSVIVADRANGYVRSMNGPMRLNVDASPQLLPGGNVRIRISIEYMPRQASGENLPAMLNEAVTLVLEPGKPFIISQAADPSADRTITVEARLTVMK